MFECEPVQGKLARPSKATSARKQAAAQLLMKAMVHKNVPFNFVTSEHFQSYVEYVSNDVFTAPSRYDLVNALEQTCEMIAAKVQEHMRKQPFIFVESDSWSTAGRHLLAVTTGNAGSAVHLNSYENLGSDTADVGAAALHDCVMTSDGYKIDMDPASPDLRHSVCHDIRHDQCHASRCPRAWQNAALQRLDMGAMLSACGKPALTRPAQSAGNCEVACTQQADHSCVPCQGLPQAVPHVR